jgi:O-antigen/teichoic acid export membrane protein
MIARDSGLRRLRRHRLVQNFTSLLVAEGVTRSLSIMTVAIVSRVVGPIAVGSLALAQALTSFATMLGDGGITTLTQREIAANPAAASEQATAATLTQLALALATGGIFFAGALLLPIPGAASLLVLFLLPIVLAQALSLVYVLQALEHMRAVAVVRIAIQVVTTALAVGFVLLTGDVIWMAIAIWVGVLCGDVLCLAILVRHGLRPLAVPLVTTLELIQRGLPFLGITLLTQALLGLDVIVLGFLRAPQEVGEYAAAFRLVFFAFTLSGILAQATFPQLVRRFGQDFVRFQGLLRLMIRLAARFTFPFTALVVVGADFVVHLVFGPAFASSTPLVRILAFWIPIGFYNSMVAVALVAAGRQRDYLTVVAVGTAVTAISLLSTVPVAGGMGAAGSILLREMVMLVLFSIVAARLLRTPTLGQFAGQLPWLLIPLATTGAVQLLLPDATILLPLAAWLLAVLGLEWATGWGLYRELTGARSRGDWASPE